MLVYLPIVLCGYFVAGRLNKLAAAAWLFGSSVVFYGMWDARYVALLLTSITFNYVIGTSLATSVSQGARRRASTLIRVGVIGNLCALGYFKYANFFLDSAALVAGADWQIEKIALPIGISFYTFTQIAFLVDAYRGQVREVNPVHYGLFVTYFPHLIAGPILHHREMMPQFADAKAYEPRWRCFAQGIAIFAIGLFKKVVIADGIAPYASPAFAAAAAGQSLNFFEAWGGAFAYTFQLYFDFSAYSDMAIGLSRMFGIRLPINFNSPYKATSIIDFWRRWHMTLSRFLRDYLYIYLGGNRHGKTRRYVNLFLTMVIGGLWHGAGWTFVVWGALHGFYLMVNHAWRGFWRRAGHDASAPRWHWKLFSTVLTFLAVVVGWVFFRADNLGAAVSMTQSMVGLHGFAPANAQWGTLPVYSQLEPGILPTVLALFGALPAYTHAELVSLSMLFSLLACAWLIWSFPNSQQIMVDHEPALGEVASDGRLRWKPTWVWSIATSITLIVALTQMDKVSEFLYFQF
ncbi:MBOAT family O-acyltransferase [Hydrogenophaga sp.]|uniref:MBOAT family O-acyltransferase n=1 Tax=Hydrogenophaga sp. TaxID=1904254 RepID=UPI003F716349